MMISSIFSLILVIIGSSQVASQSAICEYNADSQGYGYTCMLKLMHVDDSTQITGQHLRGKSDDDVRTVDTGQTNSSSAKIPVGLCGKFQNAENIYMSSIGIEEINGKSFKNCKKLQFLLMNENKIKNIAKNAFADLKTLRSLCLDGNQIQTLPDGIFAQFINLSYLQLRNNKLTTLTYSWFGDTVNQINGLYFNNNNINFIDKRIISNNPELEEILGYLNPCTSKTEEVIRKPKIEAYLAKCFIKDEDLTVEATNLD